MFTDVAGYTSLSQRNEALALQLLEEHRSRLRPIISRHNGIEVKTIGDAFLVEFSSALEALRCAFEIQESMHEMNSDRTRENQFLVRVGIHLGDVLHSKDDVYGDAVNIASRIEPLATPGGICISQQVYDQIKNKFDYPLVSLGKKSLKNVRESIEVYSVALPWDHVAAEEPSEFPLNRIAILPFTSFSVDPNDAFFADGIMEEVISTVAGLSGLNVISRTSVMGYRGTTKKISEIGKELKVGSILEGSFRKAGNRIRVTTQLIEVADDRHLWAQNYDRNLDDVFEVQSDIARQVAEALRVKILSPEKERLEKKPTQNTTAYTLYLKGRQLWNTRKLDDINKARELFEKSVQEDPTFALGYAGQADCFNILRINFRIDPDVNMQRAKALAVRALEIDPDLAEAHATLGRCFDDESNSKEAEEEFRKAIELKPSYATAHQWYSTLLRHVFRWDDALAESKRAAELDPLSQIIITNYSNCLVALGQAEEALKVIESAERVDPSSLMILRSKGYVLILMRRIAEAGAVLDKGAAIDAKDGWLLDLQGHYQQLIGNYTKAIETWQKAMTLGKEKGGDVTGYNADLASAYWMLGEKEKALACVQRIEAMPEMSGDALGTKLFLKACGYAAIGNTEDFFAVLSLLVENRTADFSWFRSVALFYPASEEFVHDARWNRTLEAAGLQSWQEKIDSQARQSF